MEFWEGISQLLISGNGTLNTTGNLDLLIFATASALMGTVVVTMDILLFYFGGRSFLNLGHGWPKSLSLLFLWGIGAGFGGFLGASADILQINRMACLCAGVGWPFILPRLLEKIGKHEEEQEVI